ncbi:hypothetical protein ACFVTT_23400, partial [Streptomyces niveus]
MSTTPEPFRYIDADQFCLSARLLPDFATGGTSGTVSMTIEGEEPQSVHVPVSDMPKILAGLAAASGVQPGARPTPDTEREDRYAAAIKTARRSLSLASASVDLPLAAAARAVADEEQRDLREALRKAQRAAALLAGSHREAEELRTELELAERVKRSAARDAAAALDAQLAAEAELEQARANGARLTAILRLTSGRPGYHTVTVKQLLTAGQDDEAAGSGGQTEDGAQPKPTAAALLATPCDACRHTLNWHDNQAGCTVARCVCGRWQA